MWFPSGLLPSGFKIYAMFFTTVRARCPTYLTLLDLIVVIFGEEYKL
jgi:membrane-associated PAP2 superfamily phosphatase